MEPAAQPFRELMSRTGRVPAITVSERPVREPLTPTVRGLPAFTLLELVLVIAIIGTISGVGVSHYMGYKDKVLVQEALSDIASLDLAIHKYVAENGRFPNSLDEIGKDGMKDPWGNPYQYLNLSNDPKKNKCRKIRNVHPINTDFDLYSSGKDGKSLQPINAEPSWDDVIRAYDGAYMGLARDII